MHPLIEVIPKRCLKCGFLCFWWLYKDLIVPTVAIHEGKAFMTSNCIHQNVNIGQWELIFRASLIEILKIYSNSYLAAFLLYKNYISQPIWTFNFFYKSCPQKLIHFSFNFSSTSKWYFLGGCFTCLALGFSFNLCVTKFGLNLAFTHNSNQKHLCIPSIRLTFFFLLSYSGNPLLTLTNFSPSSLLFWSISTSSSCIFLTTSFMYSGASFTGSLATWTSFGCWVRFRRSGLPSSSSPSSNRQNSYTTFPLGLVVLLILGGLSGSLTLPSSSSSLSKAIGLKRRIFFPFGLILLK